MASSGIVLPARVPEQLHAPCRKQPQALKLRGRPPIDRRHSPRPSACTCITTIVENFISSFSQPHQARLPHPKSATSNPHHPPRLKASSSLNLIDKGSLNLIDRDATPLLLAPPAPNSASSPPTASPAAPSSAQRDSNPAAHTRPRPSGTRSTPPPTPTNSPRATSLRR